MLIIPNRRSVGIQLARLLPKLDQLPKRAISLMCDVILDGTPISDAAAAYGLPEDEAARNLTAAMLAIHDFIHEVSAIHDIGHDDTDAGLWPTSQLPIDGRVEAYLAIADSLRKNGCRPKAIAAFAYAGKLAKAPGIYPDAANALQLTGTTFLGVAKTANLAERHQGVLLCAAKSYLEQARAVAELIRDEKTIAAVLLDLGRIHLQQKNIAMAMVYTEIAKRHTDVNQDELQQEQIRAFNDQVQDVARKEPADN
jgi:hypothetical protein